MYMYIHMCIHACIIRIHTQYVCIHSVIRIRVQYVYTYIHAISIHVQYVYIYNVCVLMRVLSSAISLVSLDSQSARLRDAISLSRILSQSNAHARV
jgi:hypothetical protein